MDIYGYEVDAENLLNLQEVCLQMTLAEIKEFACFIEHVTKCMEKYGSQFGHEHFSDFSKNMINCPDIIISFKS